MDPLRSAQVGNPRRLRLVPGHAGARLRRWPRRRFHGAAVDRADRAPGAAGGGSGAGHAGRTGRMTRRIWEG